MCGSTHRKAYSKFIIGVNMIIFDTNIETTVRILEYCEDDVFEYKELESLQINDNRRIDLSVLLYLKAEKVDAPIELILNLIYLGKEKKAFVSEAGEDVQIVKRLRLWQLPLARLSEDLSLKKERVISNDLQDDPWQLRRTIKLNILHIPVIDCGSYAVALYGAKENTNFSERELLDCAYFDIV